MLRRTLLTVSAILILTFPRIIPAGELPVAKPEDVGLSSEKLALVAPAMRKFVDDRKVAGAITIVARRGKVVLFETVGQQNIAAEKPMARDTLFRIYSMSKPITSVAVMLLAQDGKLSLDDPIAKHLPEFADVKVFASVKDGELQHESAQRPPTIRDLLRHTSGLTYGLFGNTEVDQRYRAADVLRPESSLAEMTKKLGAMPLLHQPGTRFQYSVSTDVLGRVIEVASRRDFDDFLRERVFEPLDMRDTSFFVTKDKLERFAANYGSNLVGGLRVVDAPATSPYRRDPGLHSGGGGLVSTARDYIRFCQMLLNQGELDGRRLLRAESVAAMTKNQLPDGAYPLDMNGKRPGVGFGLGFSVVVEQTPFSRQARVGEFGWGGAASTHFWVSPNDELAVVVLTQLMPFSGQMEAAVKPLVYAAILEDRGNQR